MKFQATACNFPTDISTKNVFPGTFRNFSTSYISEYIWNAGTVFCSSQIFQMASFHENNRYKNVRHKILTGSTALSPTWDFPIISNLRNLILDTKTWWMLHEQHLNLSNRPKKNFNRKSILKKTTASKQPKKVSSTFKTLN